MKSLPFSRPCASRRVTIALDRPPDLTLDSTCLDRVPRSRSRLPACLLIDSPVSGVGSRLLVCLFVGVRSALQQSVSPSQNYVVLFGIIASRTLRGVGVAYTSDTDHVTAVSIRTVRYTLPPTGACIAIWPGMRAWLGPGHTTIRRGSPIATGGSAPGHKPGTRRAIARGVLSYHHSNPPCLRLAACCRVHRRSFSLLSSSQM